MVKPKPVSRTSEGTLLGGRIRYRQLLTGHRSGFEPVLLAAAVPARPGERVLEAGTGAGAALLCLAARVPGLSGAGLEIDPTLAALAQENFEINRLHDFVATQGDAAEPPYSRVFDRVLANPPWHDAAGTASPDRRRALAHQAPAGLLAAWIGGLTRVLKPTGSLTLILPAAALATATAALAAVGYDGVTVLPLLPRQGRAARQIILQAMPGCPSRRLPGLVLHDTAGITPEAEAVLRHGAALPMD